jgi:hypothetical protein
VSDQVPFPSSNVRAMSRDDRVDAVAGAVAHFQRAMMMDVDQAAKAMRDEEMHACASALRSWSLVRAVRD